MSAEKPPKWLPDGWIMEVRTTKRGSKCRYYTSPVSRHTFRSRLEVLRCLNIEKSIGEASMKMANVGDDKQHLVAHMGDSPEWLPSGWILEIKTLMSGPREGQKYKCYFDPTTGSRFYSKREVFRYLKKGKHCSAPSHKKSFNTGRADNVISHKKGKRYLKKGKHCSAPSRKKSLNTSPADNVISQSQYSPEGLPHGWIKEIKFRKTTLNKSGVRKDPYYVDPVNGYIFRSLRDAFRYIETGEVSKYAIRGHKRRISDIYPLEKESPLLTSTKKLKSQGGAVRRCLFLKQVPNSNGETMMEIDQSSEKAQLESSVLQSQCVESVDLTYSIPSKPKQSEGKGEKGIDKVSNLTNKKLSRSTKYLEMKAKKEKGKVSEPETCESMEKKQPEALNQMPLDPLERKQLDLLDEPSVVAVKKLSNLSKKKQQKVVHTTPLELPAKTPPEMEKEKHLELENEMLPISEVKLLGPDIKKLLVPEEKLLEPENKLLLPEKQQSQEACEKLDKGVRKRGACKAQKAISLPRRASKRLAGIEADHVTDISNHERSCQINSKLSGELISIPVRGSNPCNQHNTMPVIHLEHFNKPETEEILGEKSAAGEQGGEGRPTDDWPDSPLAIPSGHSWPDPCIEFAFKTLTGDIPVLDNFGFEGYFQQQLVSLQSSSLNGLVSLFSDGSTSQTEQPPQMVQLEKRCPSTAEESKQGSSGNEFHSKGKVNREPRRSARLKK